MRFYAYVLATLQASNGYVRYYKCNNFKWIMHQRNTINIDITFCFLIQFLLSCQMTCCVSSILLFLSTQDFNQQSIILFIIVPLVTVTEWRLLHRLFHRTNFILTWIIPLHQMPVLISRPTEQKLVREWQKYLHKAAEMDCEVWFPGFQRGPTQQIYVRIVWLRGQFYPGRV